MAGYICVLRCDFLHLDAGWIGESGRCSWLMQVVDCTWRMREGVYSQPVAATKYGDMQSRNAGECAARWTGGMQVASLTQHMDLWLRHD